jgi:hypothetical protein
MFLEFIYRLLFKKLNTFPNWTCFHPQVRETPLLIFWSNDGDFPFLTDKTACVSFPLPEDGNRSNFRNVVFLGFKYWAMGKVQKPSDPECYAPSSETWPFSVPQYSFLFYGLHAPQEKFCTKRITHREIVAAT